MGPESPPTAQQPHSHTCVSFLARGSWLLQILSAAVSCLAKSATFLLSSSPRAERMQLARDTLERHYSKFQCGLGSCCGCSNPHSILTGAAVGIVGYLQQVETGENADPQSKRDPLISRSLVVLGLFCQHFDFDSELADRDGGKHMRITVSLRQQSLSIALGVYTCQPSLR